MVSLPVVSCMLMKVSVPFGFMAKELTARSHGHPTEAVKPAPVMQNTKKPLDVSAVLNENIDV